MSNFKIQGKPWPSPCDLILSDDHASMLTTSFKYAREIWNFVFPSRQETR